jgi:hypothetical protein
MNDRINDAFDRLMVEVGEPPSWDELTAPSFAPPKKNPFVSRLAGDRRQWVLRVSLAAAAIAVVVGGLLVARPEPIIAGIEVPVTNGFYLLTADAIVGDVDHVSEELAVLGLPVVVIVEPASPSWVGELHGWPTNGFQPLPGSDRVDPDERWTDRFGIELVAEARNNALVQDMYGDAVIGLRIPTSLTASITITAYRATKPGERWTASTALDQPIPFRCEQYRGKTVEELVPILDDLDVTASWVSSTATNGDEKYVQTSDISDVAGFFVLSARLSGPDVATVEVNPEPDDSGNETAVPDTHWEQLGCPPTSP